MRTPDDDDAEMDSDISTLGAAGGSAVTPGGDLQPPPGDALDRPLRELRQLGCRRPPTPSPELSQLLLTGLPRLRSRRRRRIILISGALAATMATGVTGMAAANDSPHRGIPAPVTTTSRFEPDDRPPRLSLAPRPESVVPDTPPSSPGAADDATSPPLPSPALRSTTPRHESEAPDDRARTRSPWSRPSTSPARRDE